MSGEDDKTIVSIPVPWQSQGNAVARRCPKCGLEVSDTTMVCPVDNTAIFESPGKVLADTYEFISVSGWGGMSVIYKARQRGTGNIVAIKMLHSLLVSDQALRRFQQEAKAIMSLRHPNIIAVHDFGVSEHGQPYMVMDFIEGKTLADVIKESGGLSLEASLPRFIQLCDALEHAHEAGVLHRDLKPSNVMISKTDGNFEDARIVDFGIAKLLDKEGENKDVGHLTQTGELFGSPLYMSPEQCRGQSVDERTDIYSMGCVMYETLTGRPPFMGATIVDTLMLQMNEAPDSLTDASKGKRFTREVEEVIAKTLAKSPEDRYQTMHELEMALMSIQPNKQADSQQMRGKKNKKQTTVPKFVYGAIISFVFVIFIVGIFWSNYRPRTPTVSKEAEEKRAKAVNDLVHVKLQQASMSGKLQKILQHEHWKIDDPMLRETCSDGDLQIVELDLNEAEVGDVGTRFLANQVSLQKLYLDDTHVSDGTVSVIAHLPNIDKLSLKNDDLTDGAFVNFSNPKIWGIYLGGSEGIGDKSMFYLTLLPKLKDLDVTKSSITGAGFRYLHRTHLKKLWAADTVFGDDALHSLQRTDELTDLYLGNTKITNAGFVKLDAPLLKELDISNTKVTDIGIKTLARFPELTTLRMTGLPLTDPAAEVLSKLPKLEQLNIERTKVTDKTIRMLATLPVLRELNANSVQFTDAGLEALSHAPKLEQLNLTNTKITDVGLKHLAKLKTLKTLVLLDCHNLTLAGLRQFKKDRPKCGVFVIEPADTF